MSDRLWIVLPINPEPWAIGPVGYSRRNGKMSAYVGQNQQLDAYKHAVSEAAREVWGALPPLRGNISLDFFFWRNRAEYTTPAARLHRKHDADVTNMQKATEDGLQGVIFENDRETVEVHSRIISQGPDVVGKVVVAVRLIEDPDTLIDMIPLDIIDKVNKIDTPPPTASQAWGADEDVF